LTNEIDGTEEYEEHPTGKYVTVNIIGDDKFNSDDYYERESIRDKHIYCNVKVIIGDADDYRKYNNNFTPKYERTVVLSVFGVYTGQDG